MLIDKIQKTFKNPCFTIFNMSNHLTANKGEWTEIYVFFKLLAEGKLHHADESLEKIPEEFYKILTIIREEQEKNWEYRRNSIVKVVNGDTGEMVLEVPIERFVEEASTLLRKLKNPPKRKRTFAFPKTEQFMEWIKIQHIRQDNTETSDIIIVVHDYEKDIDLKMGFSIKSQIGNSATLVNASGNTNFVYKIKGLKYDSNLIKEVNSIKSRNKIKKRLKKIEEKGGKLCFNRIDSKEYTLNMEFIDTSLPQIMGAMVLDYYSSKRNKVLDLIEQVKKENICGFDLEHNQPFYESRVKKFIIHSALGMVPSEIWDEDFDITSGFIIAREDGELICYHIGREEFTHYLMNNVKLDTASSGRWKFGKIYEENGELYIKLNLQVRFLK